jgi:hypothetical protein
MATLEDWVGKKEQVEGSIELLTWSLVTGAI